MGIIPTSSSHGTDVRSNEIMCEKAVFGLILTLITLHVPFSHLTHSNPVKHLAMIFSSGEATETQAAYPYSTRSCDHLVLLPHFDNRQSNAARQTSSR